MSKIRVSAVSYLNTKPFLAGLEQSDLHSEIDLDLAIPSLIAKQLKNGTTDIALVPVAVIPELPVYHLLTDYCIGTEGAVKTVCLYSQIPLQHIKRVFLDYHSRTSVKLLQILFKKFWKKPVEFISGYEGYEREIRDNTAGLIIGDRAIHLAKNYQYEYDLGTAWKQFTGLPFVFAAWVSQQKFPNNFIQRLNRAFQIGMQQIPSVAQVYSTIYPPDFNVRQYLNQHISYSLDAPKKEGLALFLSHIGTTTKV